MFNKSLYSKLAKADELLVSKFGETTSKKVGLSDHKHFNGETYILYKYIDVWNTPCLEQLPKLTKAKIKKVQKGGRQDYKVFPMRNLQFN